MLKILLSSFLHGPKWLPEFQPPCLHFGEQEVKRAHVSVCPLFEALFCKSYSITSCSSLIVSLDSEKTGICHLKGTFWCPEHNWILLLRKEKRIVRRQIPAPVIWLPHTLEHEGESYVLNSLVCKLGGSFAKLSKFVKKWACSFSSGFIVECFNNVSMLRLNYYTR